MPEIVLRFAEVNAHARGFYERLGFRPDGGRDVWRGLSVVCYRMALSAGTLQYP